MKIDKEERIRRAEELFVSGYNCSQAVVAAFADLFGFTEEQGLKLSAGMGGGMGRLRMTCGAVSGMAILAGMDCGSADASDREGKSANYKVVQELCERFKSEHQSLICAELLNIRKGAPLSYEASERTAEYYKTRPCVNMVVTAAKIFADYLDEKK
ncbi:MAG: C-GCAxxG-C-C family protein [Prevotellaceae bacterium]|nr:C-GCAxxG-C-C family protein [Prevotellaceae bacterium]